MKLKTIATLLLPVSIAMTALSATPAFATTSQNKNYTSVSSELDFATNVFNYQEGKGISERFRANTDNAKGRPQSGDTRNFLSLGLGGSAIFEFGEYFFPEITIWETTWGTQKNQNGHNEKVEVLVGNDLNNWISLGIIENIDDGAYIKPEGATIKAQDKNIANTLFRYVKLVDKSPTISTSTEKATSGDGFDVNAIAVKGAKAVPEPTSMMGLLTFGAIGANSLYKRKKRKA
ncbi:PEP-CTERM sorting domain-containing protein [Calothrix sp. 336/3]|uniref:PEP-CTERM sorting domain-containing protein n=1 Tax=Calothrix sp. 336/3 TaxID=1337936 RepID=UPI0004E3B52B|nr:PEP-CTERM sorting domain-containing protein [Calothrix sp. 336/3]AKG20691.1 hypothetical protein IJ00_04665 [Calothrix sp. 336/3]